MDSHGLPDYLCQEDLDFFDRELAHFVPDRVFDCHAHLWHLDFSRMGTPPPGFPDGVTGEDYLKLTGCLHPGRKVGAFFLPKPLLHRDEQWKVANGSPGRWTAGQPFGGPVW